MTQLRPRTPLRLWIADEQPDILGNKDSFGDIAWTSDEIYEHLYEPLRAKYPSWVKRVSLGADTSGRYAMYAYEFTPEKWEKTVYIQSGVHFVETEGFFGLARLMHLIAEPTNERFAYLREKVRFLVVPMVSVWGISNSKTRQHNVLGINSNRDYYDCKLSETVNVKNYFASHADNIDFMFDFHTTTTADWGAYLLAYPDGLDTAVITRLVQIASMLYGRNCPPDTPVAYMGDEGRYPTSPITSSFTAGFFKEYHVPGSTLEHSDFIFDNALGTKVCMTRAIELYANHVFAAVGC